MTHNDANKHKFKAETGANDAKTVQTPTSRAAAPKLNVTQCHVITWDFIFFSPASQALATSGRTVVDEIAQINEVTAQNSMRRD